LFGAQQFLSERAEVTHGICLQAILVSQNVSEIDEEMLSIEPYVFQ
jgi:hypothetical protein